MVIKKMYINLMLNVSFDRNIYGDKSDNDIFTIYVWKLEQLSTQQEH